jgi:hypothetical protein
MPEKTERCAAGAPRTLTSYLSSEDDCETCCWVPTGTSRVTQMLAALSEFLAPYRDGSGAACNTDAGS